ncbi:MAG: YdaU family protein [Desulfobulbaceae bacterium]|nr:YdaU family protein [Desulfobulbaceae bacterium]
MHFYQFHIGDYRRDTSHLTPIEDIAYRRLLDLYYLDERPLQKDGIARKIGMREYEHDVLVVLKEFFVETECGWINKRAEAQVKQYQARIEDGKRGAAKRWGKDGDTSPNSPPIEGGAAYRFTDSSKTLPDNPPNSPPNSPPIERVIPNHKPITNNHVIDGAPAPPIAPDKNKKTKIPPHKNEIYLYMVELGLSKEVAKVETVKYYDHHEARGWVLSNGKKMVSWKAAARTWKGNISVYANRNGTTTNNRQLPDFDAMDDAAFWKLYHPYREELNCTSLNGLIPTREDAQRNLITYMQKKIVKYGRI